MNHTSPRIADAARKARLNPQRSPLFHWLTKHYPRLSEELTGRRTNWIPLIAAALKAGVKDGQGHDPSERTMQRTWKDVRAYVATEQQAAQAPKPPRKLQPRDLPANWRPTPVAVPPTAAAGPPTSNALAPLTHPDQVRVVGQASFGPITSGPLTPEPDYTGMDEADRKIARAKWHIALRQPG